VIDIGGGAGMIRATSIFMKAPRLQMFSWKNRQFAMVMGSLLTVLAFEPLITNSPGATIVGPTVTLASLLTPGATLTVFDKTFSEFQYTASGDMPIPANVNVTPIQDDFGNYGIRFQGGFMDLAVNTPGPSDALIEYMVEAGPGYLISDAHLMGNPNVMGEFGAINVTETFLPLGAGGEYTMEIFDDENADMAQLMDETFFLPPVKKLSVQKDIAAFAPPNGMAVALSFVDQTFSQVIVPEPVTVVSLVSSIVAMGLWRRGRGLPRRRSP
jgi:hypothetical protein